jgi:hypothetical protein
MLTCCYECGRLRRKASKRVDLTLQVTRHDVGKQYMIEIARIIIVTFVIGWLGWFLGRTLVDGLRTGKIRHTDSKSRCDRKKNPLGYWALVCFFAGLLGLLGWVWVKATTDAWTKIIER